MDKNLKEDPKSVSFPCLRVRQPIGEFYIATINSKLLYKITWTDIRRIFKEREIETYLGIQRPLNPKRVREIAEYANTIDACFPTSVILAVHAKCATYNDKTNTMILSNYVNPDDDEEKIIFGEIAKVLDGQHRIEGLKDYEGDDFDINVSIFVDVDVAEQAYIFSTVNLAQTKVNKSLVYDLYDLAKARSPQKVCHMIAVALDEHEKSPFYKRIKRLGAATEGRYEETITQATFVESIIKYMTDQELKDRDTYKRGGKPKLRNAEELKKLIFANMVVEEKDVELADIIWNYFDAVKKRWPDAWNATGQGAILNKTNGFRGLMRFLRKAYLHITAPGGVPTIDDFYNIFTEIQIDGDFFNTENFKPGTSGETDLYRMLLTHSGL